MTSAWTKLVSIVKVKLRIILKLENSLNIVSINVSFNNQTNYALFNFLPDIVSINNHSIIIYINPARLALKIIYIYIDIMGTRTKLMLYCKLVYTLLSYNLTIKHKCVPYIYTVYGIVNYLYNGGRVRTIHTCASMCVLQGRPYDYERMQGNTFSFIDIYNVMRFPSLHTFCVFFLIRPISVQFQK